MKKKSTIIIIIIGAIIILGVIAAIIVPPLLKNKYIPVIENLTFEYVPGMEYNTYEELNKDSETKKVESQTIKLSEQELKSLKKQINKVSEKEKKKDFDVICKIMINKKNTLLIGNKISSIEVDKKITYIKTPTTLIEEINNIIDKNNNKILETMDFEKFVIKKSGAVITLANKDNIQIIKNALPYYKINLNDDYSSYDGGYHEIAVIDESTVIYLYSSKIGYIKKGEEAYYAIFPYDLEEAINSIYEVSVK